MYLCMEYKTGQQLYLLMVSGEDKQRGQLHFGCMYTVIETFVNSDDVSSKSRLLKCCKPQLVSGSYFGSVWSCPDSPHHKTAIFLQCFCHFQLIYKSFLFDKEAS